jgi:hypothetical protein
MEGVALDTGGRMRQEVYWIDIFHEDYISAMEFRQAGSDSVFQGGELTSNPSTKKQ